MAPNLLLPHTRFRRSLVIFSLVCLLASAGPIRAVVAAPGAAGSVTVSLQAEQVGAERTLCVGDQVQIRLKVWKRFGVEGRFVLRQLANISIGANVVGSGGVGSISPNSSQTSLTSQPPGAAYFTFKAEKPGSVIVAFNARVTNVAFLGLPITIDTIGTQRLLTVEDCKYRVSLFSRWRIPGEAPVTILAKVHIAGLVEDGGGHYQGTARVQWAAHAGAVGDCQGSLLPDSQATVTGQVYGPEELVIDVDYETSNAPINIDCDGIGGPMPYALTPDPLTFSVSASGGQVTLAHVLHGPSNVPGTVVVVVKRAQGQ